MTKVYTKYLLFNTKNRRELIKITDKVQKAVKKSGIMSCICNALTASVFIQDDKGGLHQDIWE